VLAFVAAVTLVTSVLFDLAPALRGSRVEPTAGLHQAGRSVSEGRPANRLRAALVISQTGLAVMLLIAGGLVPQSFARLTEVEVEFRGSRVAGTQSDPDRRASQAAYAYTPI